VVKGLRWRSPPLLYPIQLGPACRRIFSLKKTWGKPFFRNRDSGGPDALLQRGFKHGMLSYMIRRIMEMKRHPSPRLAIAIIYGCAVVTLLIFQYTTWQHYVTQSKSLCGFPKRYEKLAPLLPDDEASRFVVDRSCTDLKKTSEAARLFLAQYVVSPKRIGSEVESSWVVVDSDCVDREPQIAKTSHWTLVSDLRNGVRLYRTDGRSK
jgi:hypothetical protein